MIDFRETMPAAGNETMYINTTVPNPSTIGGLAVGVPGELRGWEKLHQRHGKLPWKTLFQPAIKLARDGFTVTTDLAAALSASMSSLCTKVLEHSR
jgi:gamma-glutamyltranspeptidase / glutathione hydrolase